MSMAVTQLEPLRVSDQDHQFVTNFEFQELKTKIDQTTQKFETLVSWIWYRFGYNEPTFPEILRPSFYFEKEKQVAGSSPQCSEPQSPSPTTPAPSINENVILVPEFEQEAENFSKNDVEVEPEDLEDILGTETEESLENEYEPLSLSQQEQIATLTKPCFVSLIRLITLSDPSSETELPLPHSGEIEIIELQTSESEPPKSTSPIARPICEIPFNRKENQFKDMKVHSEDRLHTCEICDKGFKKLSNLKAHLETHSAPKSFKCEHEGCGRTYKYERHLANHFGTHVNGTQRFECKNCGRTYLKKSSLKDHLRNHTPETPYTCTICGASFSQQCQWQRHNAMVHPGQKPFNCDVCGKGFIQRGQLQTHLNVHKMGEKEFCCEVCKSGKIFSWRELHQHFEFFHGDK